MGERINVAMTAAALSAGFAAGSRAFADSLARNAQRDREARAWARVERRAYDDAAAAIARRELRDMLGL